jgi:hypothetical protein
MNEPETTTKVLTETQASSTEVTTPAPVVESAVQSTETPADIPKEPTVCPRCKCNLEGHIELVKGPPRKQPWGGKLVKLTPVVMACTECGEKLQLVGLEKARTGHKDAVNKAVKIKNRRKQTKQSRKRNRG